MYCIHCIYSECHENLIGHYIIFRPKFALWADFTHIPTDSPHQKDRITKTRRAVMVRFLVPTWLARITKTSAVGSPPLSPLVTHTVELSGNRERVLCNGPRYKYITWSLNAVLWGCVFHLRIHMFGRHCICVSHICGPITTTGKMRILF